MTATFATTSSSPRRSRRLVAENGTQPRVAVLAPLDGKLLHATNAEIAAARDVIRRLHEAGAAVVGISPGTLEEVAPVASALQLRSPMIIEAFGAIAHRTPQGWAAEACGLSSDLLLDALRDIEDRSGASLLVYSALREDEAARLTGLAGVALRASMTREFSEPFLIEYGDAETVSSAAAEIGLSICSDGTFLYPVSNASTSLLRVLFETRCQRTIAFGTAPIDEQFLSLSDIAVIVPGADGTIDPHLLRRVPDAQRAPAAAPQGWLWAFDRIWPGLDDAKSAAV